MIRSTCFVFGEKIRPNTKGGIQSGNKMKRGNMACQWFQNQTNNYGYHGFLHLSPQQTMKQNFQLQLLGSPSWQLGFFTMHPGLTRKLEIKVGEEVTDIQTLGEG